MNELNNPVAGKGMDWKWKVEERMKMMMLFAAACHAIY
jgi:hypothetical protein